MTSTRAMERPRREALSRQRSRGCLGGGGFEQKGQNAAGQTHGPSQPEVSRPEVPRRDQRSPLPRELLTGLSVLVVDDDIATVEYFAAALGRCGARVTTAFSAREALDAIQAERPDVVLTDIAMPGGDGYWMLSEMRARLDQARTVPVVAATAYGREHSRERTLAAGFAEHLAKPVEPEVLCRTIARAAGRV